MSDHQHTIGRLDIEVKAPQPGQAAQLQQQLGYRLHTSGFLRQLESLLDSLVKPDEYLEIPRITISLDCADDAGFHAQFMQLLAAAVREQMEKKPDGVSFQGSAAYAATIRSFFLKYGIQASYNGKDMIATLQQELKALPDKEQPELEQLLKVVGREDPVVWTRLFYLLGATGMKKFFLRFFDCREDQWRILMREKYLLRDNTAVAPFTGAARSAVKGSSREDVAGEAIPDAALLDAGLWQALFEQQLNGGSTAAPAQNAAMPQTRESYPVTGSTRAYERTTAFTEQLQQGLQVDNAGLVLLWMECGRLFRSLGYVADRQFVSEEAQQQAVLLLYYISTGLTAGGEEECLLNKLLCAWPLHMPVNPALAPDETAQQAAGEMLAAYLETWRKDRKFSAAWFRTAYLQREGTLYCRPDGRWLLEVTARTEDILINKTSMVKYAWMPQMLFVQW